MKTFRCNKCGHELQRPTQPYKCPQCGTQAVGLFKLVQAGGQPGVPPAQPGVPPVGPGCAGKPDRRSADTAGHAARCTASAATGAATAGPARCTAGNTAGAAAARTTGRVAGSIAGAASENAADRAERKEKETTRPGAFQADGAGEGETARPAGVPPIGGTWRCPTEWAGQLRRGPIDFTPKGPQAPAPGTRVAEAETAAETATETR